MDENKWKLLGVFLLNRLKNPIKHPEYFIYFILVIVGVGAIGVYSAIIKGSIPDNKMDFIIANMASYFLAIVATGSVELVLSNEKYIGRAIRLLAMFAVLINIALYFTSVAFSSVYISLTGVIIALLVWWIANAENTNIIEKSFDSQIRNEAYETHGKNW